MVLPIWAGAFDLLACPPPPSMPNPAALDWWHARVPAGPDPYPQFLGGASSGADFVAVGYNTIQSSTNGILWENRTPTTGYYWHGVTYAKSLYLAVGSSPNIYISPNGINWTNYPSSMSTSLFACGYGNNVFVAVGLAGAIVTSSDGTNWTPRTSATDLNLFGTIYANGLFVVVGDRVILTSPDGIAWTTVGGPAAMLWGVAYGSGRFVAVGLDGAILSSLDGTNWTAQSSGTTAFLRDVIYARGKFIAVGYEGTLLSSADGSDWRQHSSGTTRPLHGITAGCHSLMAVGAGGAILESDPLFFTPPALYRQPESQVIKEGNAVSFDIIALGTSPLNYQWFHDSQAIGDATNASLAITNIQRAHEGSYWIVITNIVGSATSVVATLSVCVPPTLVQSPVTQSVVPGDSVTFSVEVSGTPPFSYRWRKPGPVYVTNVLDQPISFLTVTNVQTNDAGAYAVLVLNACGFVNSAVGFLSLLSDFDEDGLADNWETSYGFDTNSVNNAADDPDHDNLTNLEEYHAGTDPTNAESFLKIDSIRFSSQPGNEVLVGFAAVSNRTYSVLYGDALPTRWTSVVDIVARRTNWQATVTNLLPGEASTRFYLLQTPKRE